MRFMNLIVVESPTKARTLSRFLEGDFAVEATYGHVQDLPQKKLGVIIEQESGRAGEYRFELQYEQLEKQQKRMDEIKKLAGKTDKIYLATDPDREGEAIAYHVSQILKNGKKQHEFVRIVFHEITKDAIKEALEHPRKLDLKLVKAQEARRVLDRLVGYDLSGLIWKKVRYGLSAGRVQSPALRIIMEREREIRLFKSETYCVITADVFGNNKTIFKVTCEEEPKDLKTAEKILEKGKAGSWFIKDITESEVKRSPRSPFTTSTLQQAASSRLGFTPSRTMGIAQKLYEEGLITYHRTDSLNMNSVAVGKARDFIKKEYGEKYLSEKARFYKTTSKVAQEAHEAIRPTNVENRETGLEKHDFGRLYDLIWRRFVACQMTHSIYNETVIDVAAGSYLLRASGQIMVFDGWTRLRQGSAGQGKNDGEIILPEVVKDEKLELVKTWADQKFTLAPARYNEASLIKTLEKLGIGRPSTYAPTISTIQERLYVTKENLTDGKRSRYFTPTPLGILVNDFLIEHFPSLFDLPFTAKMEGELDEIAEGTRDWTTVIKEFYVPFKEKLTLIEDTVETIIVEDKKTGNKCPECKVGDEIIKEGRFGKFYACSRFPECKYTKNFLEKLDIKCPECKTGDVVIRKTKSKRVFYGCSRYPECKYASWVKPVGNNLINK